MAFVTLPSIELRNQCIRAHRIKKMRASICCRYFHKDNGSYDEWIRLEVGPKFKHISWENVSDPGLDRLKKKKLYYFFSYLICWVILYVVRALQAFVIGLFNPRTGAIGQNLYVLYLTIYIGIKVIYKVANLALSMIGKLSVGRVKDHFATVDLAYLAFIKLGAFMFSVTLLTTKSGDNPGNDEIMRKVFTTMMLDAVLQVLMKTVVSYLSYANLKIFYFYCLKKKRIMMLQKDLNKVFAKPECVIGSLTSVKLYLLYLTSFLGYFTWLFLVPPLVYLLISLFADRFLLLKFYAEPNPRDVKVSKSVFYLFWVPIAIIFFVIYFSWEIQYPDSDRRFVHLKTFYYFAHIFSFVVMLFSEPILGFFMLFFEGKAGVKASGKTGEEVSQDDGVYRSMEVSLQELDVSVAGSKDGSVMAGVPRFDEFYEDALKG